ncbi:MAG: hypothetical protein ACREPX_05150 [Rhodanobacteraceae bacterium]
MDLYLPDEFYALSEAPNSHAARKAAVDDDSSWLGGEVFVTPFTDAAAALRRKRISEPDPIWCVV